MAYFDANITPFEQKLSAARQKMADFSRQVSGLGDATGSGPETFASKWATAIGKVGTHLDRLGTRFQNAGKKWTSHVTLPIAAGVTAIMRNLYNFDKIFGQYVANADLSPKMAAIQRKRMIDLGNNPTLVGVDATDAAVMYTELARAGFTVKQQNEAAKGELRYANAASLTPDVAGNFLAKQMGMFGLKPKDAQYLADLNTKVAMAGLDDPNAVQLFLQQGGAVAHGQGHLNIRQTMALAAMASSWGLGGSSGGTDLRNGILFSMTPQSKDQAAFMRRKHLDAFKKDGSQNDFVEYLGDMSRVYKGLTNRDQHKMLKLMFGGDAQKLWQHYLDVGPAGLKKSVANVYKKDQAEIFSKKSLQGWGKTMEIFNNTASTFMTTTGQDLAPAIGKILTKMDDLMNWFQGLSDGKKKWILAMVGIGAALGPVLTIVGKLTRGWGLLFGAMHKTYRWATGQSGKGDRIDPNTGMPQGAYKDSRGRWHRQNGKFISNSELEAWKKTQETVPVLPNRTVPVTIVGDRTGHGNGKNGKTGTTTTRGTTSPTYSTGSGTAKKAEDAGKKTIEEAKAAGSKWKKYGNRALTAGKYAGKGGLGILSVLGGLNFAGVDLATITALLPEAAGVGAASLTGAALLAGAATGGVGGWYLNNHWGRYHKAMTRVGDQTYARLGIFSGRADSFDAQMTAATTLSGQRGYTASADEYSKWAKATASSISKLGDGEQDSAARSAIRISHILEGQHKIARGSTEELVRDLGMSTHSIRTDNGALSRLLTSREKMIRRYANKVRSSYLFAIPSRQPWNGPMANPKETHARSGGVVVNIYGGGTSPSDARRIGREVERSVLKAAMW